MFIFIRVEVGWSVVYFVTRGSRKKTKSPAFTAVDGPQSGYIYSSSPTLSNETSPEPLVGQGVCAFPYVAPNCDHTFAQAAGEAYFSFSLVFSSFAVLLLCFLSSTMLFAQLTNKDRPDLILLIGAACLTIRAVDPLAWTGIVPLPVYLLLTDLTNCALIHLQLRLLANWVESYRLVSSRLVWCAAPQSPGMTPPARRYYTVFPFLSIVQWVCLPLSSLLWMVWPVVHSVGLYITLVYEVSTLLGLWLGLFALYALNRRRSVMLLQANEMSRQNNQFNQQEMEEEGERRTPPPSTRRFTRVDLWKMIFLRRRRQIVFGTAVLCLATLGLPILAYYQVVEGRKAWAGGKSPWQAGIAQLVQIYLLFVWSVCFLPIMQPAKPRKRRKLTQKVADRNTTAGFPFPALLNQVLTEDARNPQTTSNMTLSGIGDNKIVRINQSSPANQSSAAEQKREGERGRVPPENRLEQVSFQLRRFAEHHPDAVAHHAAQAYSSTSPQSIPSLEPLSWAVRGSAHSSKPWNSKTTDEQLSSGSWDTKHVETNKAKTKKGL
eukprot:g78336.t1